MFDLLLITVFFSMVLSPCVVAWISSPRDAARDGKAASEAKI